MERLVLLSKVNEIKVDLLPAETLQNDCFGSELSLGQLPLDQILMNVERKLIWDALEQANGNQTRAAQILQIPPSTLRSKMKKYNLTGK